MKNFIFCAACSKVTLKALEWRQWFRSDAFIINFEQISQIALVFPLESFFLRNSFNVVDQRCSAKMLFPKIFAKFTEKYLRQSVRFPPDFQLYLKEAPAIVISNGFREILGTSNHGQNILDKL